MIPRLCALVLVGSVLSLAGVAKADPIAGYAAMGASESAGDTYTGSWVPYLATDRSLNFGGAGNPYNVAVGGATSVTLLQQGQHTQVASLVTAGNVDLAYLFIGANDFNAKATSIANGNLTGQPLTDFINGVVANIQTATDTVLAARPTGMIVSGLPDLLLTPGGRALFDMPIEQQRGTAAVNQMNATQQPMVLSRWLPFVDVSTSLRDLNAGAPFVVGGVTIDLVTPSSDPTHFFQDAIHPGAVGNGFFANLMIEAVNLGYGANIPLLSDQQILTDAGVAGYTGETSNLNYAKYIILPLAGDANGDRIVDISDVQMVASHWLAAGPLGDTNQDGLVDISDVQKIAANWLLTGGNGAGGVAVPEPSALLLALAGSLACLAGARRSRG
ncbi:MAG: hypothetical protein HYX69_08960 [Planctomycetia bacterium]|nr:hypothetical protein [Planctomycetia bacterium]